jgi:hypothetical protein
VATWVVSVCSELPDEYNEVCKTSERYSIDRRMSRRRRRRRRRGRMSRRRGRRSRRRGRGEEDE